MSILQCSAKQGAPPDKDTAPALPGALVLHTNASSAARAQSTAGTPKQPLHVHKSPLEKGPSPGHPKDRNYTQVRPSEGSQLGMATYTMRTAGSCFQVPPLLPGCSSSLGSRAGAELVPPTPKEQRSQGEAPHAHQESSASPAKPKLLSSQSKLLFIPGKHKSNLCFLSSWRESS